MSNVSAIPPIADITHQGIDNLYREHDTWFRGWLRKKLNCSHHAADLAHDTYVRLLVTGHVPAVHQSRGHLVQIAKGLLVDLFRHRRIEAAYLDAIAYLSEAETPSLETQAYIIQTLIEVDTLLDKLPTKVRLAFLLCRLDGLGYREIAERLQVSVSSVEKYVAQALLACYQVAYESHL